MKTARLPCGCRYECGGDRERWFELCPPHKAEFDEIHARWHREHGEALQRFLAPITKEVRA